MDRSSGRSRDMWRRGIVRVPKEWYALGLRVKSDRVFAGFRLGFRDLFGFWG